MGDAPRTVIESNAAQFHAIVDLVSELVDECKLRVREDGLRVIARDPANVGLIDLHAAADGFDAYDAGSECVVGLMVDHFSNALDPARKGQGVDGGDQVAVRINPDHGGGGSEFGRGRVTVTVERDEARFRSSWFALDPDSVREEPEIPEFDLGWAATPDTLAFRDALNHIQRSLDHSWVSGDGTALILGGEDDGEGVGAAVRFDGCAWNEAPEDADIDDEEAFVEDHADDASCYSLDYLAGMAAAVRKARMERLRLTWGDECPLTLEFEQPEWGIHGRYMLAPMWLLPGTALQEGKPRVVGVPRLHPTGVVQ